MTIPFLCVAIRRCFGVVFNENWPFFGPEMRTFKRTTPNVASTHRAATSELGSNLPPKARRSLLHICRTHIHMYVCVNVYMYLCMYVYMYVYGCISVCVYVCARMWADDTTKSGTSGGGYILTPCILFYEA